MSTTPRDTSGPVPVLCLYRVRRGEERAFEALLAKHWDTLREQDLAADTPPQYFRRDEDEGPLYVELFEWKDAEAPATAHELPAVMAVWEPMGALVEKRGARPDMEFHHLARIAP